MNTKRAGLRRDVLKVMASMKRAISTVQRAWNVEGTVYTGRGSVRRREQHEYPENSPAEWHKLCESLDDMITGLTIMRGMAWENYVKVRDENDAAHRAKMAEFDAQLDRLGNVS